MSLPIYLDAMAREARKLDIERGIRALVIEYYQNYTDAIELEPGFVAALELILRETGDPFHEDDLEEIIAEAEESINEYAGGVVGSDGRRHKVGKGAE